MPATAGQEELKAYRRSLRQMIAASSGIDLLTTLVGGAAAFATFGGSVLIEEGLEWLISSRIAKNRMRLKKRYRIIGLLPIPGLTAVTLQCLLALRYTRRHPEAALAALRKAKAAK